MMTIEKDTVITHEMVREQLVELGYDPENLSPELINDFVQELTLLYEHGGFDEFLADETQDSQVEEFSTEWQQTKLIHSLADSGPKIIKKSYRKHDVGHILDDPDLQPLPSGFDLHAQEEERASLDEPETSPDEIIEKLKRLDLSHVRRVVAQQMGNEDEPLEGSGEVSGFQDDEQEHHARFENRVSAANTSTTFTNPSSTYGSVYPSGFIRVPSQPKKLKKHDPVSRFHQHQAQWSHDSFLKRTQTKSARSTFVPLLSSSIPRKPEPPVAQVRPAYRNANRWGGMAEAPAPFVKKYIDLIIRRHNLAAMRSNYVVPTSKNRRDVIWEVRNRLALIQQRSV